MRKTILRALPLLLLLAWCGGCSLIDYYFLPPAQDTPQELFEAAVDAMKQGDYRDAADFFTKLKDRFPFSPYTPKAEVGLGDAHFMSKNYAQAVEAYKEFEALHPRHEDTPYVLFQIGLANYRMFDSIDTRQDNISEGLEYFYRVEQSYPDSEYAEAAKKYIYMSRRVLAEHELFIADFYWRQERYGPAWNRYAYVVKNYSDIKDLSSYARQRAQYSYYEYQKTLSNSEREAIEGTWKEWFDWL